MSADALVNTANRYWPVVSVRLFEPVRIVDPDRTAPGYYLCIGVTAPSDSSARTHAERVVADGSILWDDSKVSKVEDESIEPGILARADALEGAGAWYASGRILYPDEQ